MEGHNDGLNVCAKLGLTEKGFDVGGEEIIDNDGFLLDLKLDSTDGACVVTALGKKAGSKLSIIVGALELKLVVIEGSMDDGTIVGSHIFG